MSFINIGFPKTIATNNTDFIITYEPNAFPVIDFDYNSIPVTSISTFDYPTVEQKVPEIKNVIFNDPATIVLWEDNTKTIVKCQDGDLFDPEKGLAMCITKKALGNKSNFNNIFKKWIPTEVEKDLTIQEAIEQIATEWQKLTDEGKDIMAAILLGACGKDLNVN